MQVQKNQTIYRRKILLGQIKKKVKIRNFRHYRNKQNLQKEEVVYTTWTSVILNTFSFLASFFSIIALACSHINLKYSIKISVFDSHNTVILSIL